MTNRKPQMSSVIGESAVVLGNLNGNADVEVRGRVQGAIELRGRVLVSESGVVLGSIDAVSITVAGEVRGDLSASDGVTIETSGRVEGNISAPRVGINAGARVRGMLRTAEPESRKATEPLRNEPDAAQEQAPEGQVPKVKSRLPSSERANNSSSEEDQAPEKPKVKKRKRPKASMVSDLNKPRLKKPQKQAPAQKSDQEDASPQKKAVKRGAKTRRPGPPAPPTFIKGAKGHQPS